jgi:hypothetical protein
MIPVFLAEHFVGRLYAQIAFLLLPAAADGLVCTLQ